MNRAYRPLQEEPTVRVRVAKDLANEIAELFPELRITEACSLMLRLAKDSKPVLEASENKTPSN